MCDRTSVTVTDAKQQENSIGAQLLRRTEDRHHHRNFAKPKEEALALPASGVPGFRLIVALPRSADATVCVSKGPVPETWETRQGNGPFRLLLTNAKIDINYSRFRKELTCGRV